MDEATNLDALPHGASCVRACALSLIAPDLGLLPEVGKRAYEALRQEGLSPVSSFSAPLSLTFLIPDGLLPEATRVAHRQLIPQEVAA